VSDSIYLQWLKLHLTLDWSAQPDLSTFGDIPLQQLSLCLTLNNRQILQVAKSLQPLTLRLVLETRELRLWTLTGARIGIFREYERSFFGRANRQRNLDEPQMRAKWDRALGRSTAGVTELRTARIEQRAHEWLSGFCASSGVVRWACVFRSVIGLTRFVSAKAASDVLSLTIFKGPASPIHAGVAEWQTLRT
jgi:hypothetical protein